MMRYHYILPKMDKIKNNAGKDAKNMHHSYTASGNIK